ncbi:hypothetical protein [Roseateles sp.]|uniref:hypothetical protein n=1 Tax=Roseateles sp. TaxID=1971397 RepID=UPI002DF9DFF4|nr:hypothetical protein [Roseateles sp.]
MSPTTLALDAQQRDIEAATRAASDQRARAALLLARSPDSTQIQEELVELERELDGYQRDLQRIAAARQALAAAEAADTREAQAQRLDRARTAVLAGVADRVAATAKIEKAFKDLEAALVAEAEASTRACDAAMEAGRLLYPTNVLDAIGVLQSIQPFTLAVAPSLSHLNRVLRTAADAGHKLGQSVQIVALSDPQPSLTADAKAGADRVAMTVARWALPSADVAGAGGGHD